MSDSETTQAIGFPDPGDPPVVDWISKDVIDVDHAYQRPEDAARAAKIAGAFSWSKFGAIVVVPKDDGRYAIIDGQHRAAAAKLHPAITLLPAVIMPTVQGVTAEANSFIGLNAERKSVSGLELFHAKVAAGDDDALIVLQVTQRANIRIPKFPSDYKPGDTIAVAAVQALVDRRGAQRAREMLDVLRAAEFAPITAAQIKAVEHVITDPEFAGSVTLADLAATVKQVGDTADVEAKRFAATHCVPAWKGLASVWFQKCRKRRAPTAGGSSEIGIPTSRSARLNVVRPPSPPHRHSTITGAVFGDPPVGRSALDQRRQT